MKDYLKVIITALVTALITIVASGFVNRESKIRNSATKNDITILETKTNNKIKAVKKESFEYTDKTIEKLEESQDVKAQILRDNINYVRKSSERTEKMVERLLDIKLKEKS